MLADYLYKHLPPNHNIVESTHNSTMQFPQNNFPVNPQENLALALTLAKKQLPNEQSQKELELEVVSFLRGQLDIDVHEGHFSPRPQVEHHPGPQALTQSTILFYGTDLIGTRELQALLGERCRVHSLAPHFVSHLSHSCCRVTYLYHCDAFLVLQVLGAKANTSQWTQLHPHSAGVFTRKWWVRCATNSELFPTLDPKHRKYQEFKKAKDKLICQLISKFNLVSQYTALQRQVGFRSRTITQKSRLKPFSSLTIPRNRLSSADEQIGGSVMIQTIDLVSEQQEDEKKNNEYGSLKIFKKDLGMPNIQTGQDICPVKISLQKSEALQEKNKGADKECSSQFQVPQYSNQVDQYGQKGRMERMKNGVSEQTEEELKARQQARKNDELSRMLKLKKTRKVYREERVAVQELSSDDENETMNRQIIKQNGKRKAIEKKGYLPICDPCSTGEVDSVVLFVQPSSRGRQEKKVSM